MCTVLRSYRVKCVWCTGFIDSEKCVEYSVHKKWKVCNVWGLTFCGVQCQCYMQCGSKVYSAVVVWGAVSVGCQWQCGVKWQCEVQLQCVLQWQCEVQWHCVVSSIECHQTPGACVVCPVELPWATLEVWMSVSLVVDWSVGHWSATFTKKTCQIESWLS